MVEADCGFTQRVIGKLDASQFETLKAIFGNHLSATLLFDDIKSLVEGIDGVVKEDRGRGRWQVVLFTENQGPKILVTPMSTVVTNEDFIRDLRYILQEIGFEAGCLI